MKPQYKTKIKQEAKSKNSNYNSQNQALTHHSIGVITALTVMKHGGVYTPETNNGPKICSIEPFRHRPTKRTNQCQPEER